MGDAHKAESVWSKAQQERPNLQSFKPGWRIPFWSMPMIVRGKYKQAAGLYAEDLDLANRPVASRAKNGMVAGILTAIAGDEKGAQEIWRRVAKQFPPGKCNGYAAMARNLMHGTKEEFEAVYLSPHARATLFYLVGLLAEKRGSTEEATEFFQKSVAEDGAGGLGASFSKRKLDAIDPQL